MMIDEKTFSRLCYLTLMESGGGVCASSPDYIEEKAAMLQCGYEAFSWLDIHNMRKVDRYCDIWGLILPDVISEEMRLQEEAFASLASKGIYL